MKRNYLASFVVSIFAFAAFAAAPEVQLSEPAWMVSARSGESSSVESVPGLKTLLSNNNVAIKVYRGRLWMAFRTATHHHPKPPVWAPQVAELKTAITRMYVISAPVSETTWKDFNAEMAKLSWRMEFEVHEKLESTKLKPIFARLASEKQEERNLALKQLGEFYAAADIKKIVAASAKGPVLDAAEKFKSLLGEYDIREPLFAEIGGKLFFYFHQVEGLPLKFITLRSWALSIGEGQSWSEPVPVLNPKELHWEVKEHTSAEGTKQLLMSAYRGDHYGKGKTEVLFLKSEDGINFNPVMGDGVVDNGGGASEAAFEISPRSGNLVYSLRQEDGDERGWGTLFGKADAKTLGKWDTATEADPKRFDSPRMFAVKDELLLLARQNIGRDQMGQWNEKENYVYDEAYWGRSQEEGKIESKRRLQEIKDGKQFFKGTLFSGLGYSDIYMKDYHFNHPKRTALYWYDEQSQKTELLTQLPSAGDTAFPSLVDLGNGEFLIANYSSDPKQTGYTWNDGQNNRTGIYLIKMSVR